LNDHKKKFSDQQIQDLFIEKRKNALVKYDDKRANETQQAGIIDKLI